MSGWIKVHHSEREFTVSRLCQDRRVRGSEKETRESYGQDESRCVNIAVIRPVQGCSNSSAISYLSGWASCSVQLLFGVAFAAEMRGTHPQLLECYRRSGLVSISLMHIQRKLETFFCGVAQPLFFVVKGASVLVSALRSVTPPQNPRVAVLGLVTGYSCPM